jgi:murein DD-endopeptidase MepM/ murein hydrolase activator NlpD
MSAFDRFSAALVRSTIALAVAVCIVPGLAAAAAVDGETAGRRWVWPLSPLPAVVHAFDPPDSPYGAGHRGVDLAGSVGQPVYAIGDGQVTYAGVLAGRWVIVVTHGALRSTYEPVASGVRVGESVRAGEQIGTLTSVGSHCAPQACLHLGVLSGAEYLDPLSLLGPAVIRLKPMSGDPTSPASWSSAVRDAAVSAASYPWSAIR